MELKFLDKNTSICLKGLCAVYIMVTHLHRISIWQFNFLDCGYLAVGLFFFYSGYGLKNELNTKPNYLNDFVKTKVLKIIVPFWFAESTYTIGYSCINGGGGNK